MTRLRLKPLMLSVVVSSLCVVPLWADDTIRESPQAIPAQSTNVGTFVQNIKLSTANQKQIQLHDAGRENGLVIAYTSTSCPITRKYGPTLAKLEESLAKRKIGLLLVNPTASDEAKVDQ